MNKKSDFDFGHSFKIKMLQMTMTIFGFFNNFNNLAIAYLKLMFWFGR